MNRWRIRLALASLVLACCLLTPAVGAWAGVGGGTQRWTATYDAGTPAFSYDVAVSPDGSTVFSTGTTSYGTTAPGQMATVAVDAQTGETKWSRVYQSTGVAGQSDRGTRIAVSADGSKVFVTGESSCPYGCGSGAFSGYSTVAYDAATGHRLWAAQVADDGPGAYSIAVTPDGSTVFVNGEAAAWPGNETIAYDAATGSQLYAIPSSDYMAPWNALAVSNDSSTVFVASVSGSQCGLDISTYNVSDGTPGWSAGYPECIPADAHLAITLSRDGSTLYAVGGARGELRPSPSTPPPGRSSGRPSTARWRSTATSSRRSRRAPTVARCSFSAAPSVRRAARTSRSSRSGTRPRTAISCGSRSTTAAAGRIRPTSP